MTPRYKPYPEYKPSGVEWLGEVPRHWDVFSGKRVFGQRIARTHPDDKQLAVTQKHGVIPQEMYMKENSQKVVLALKGTENFRHVEVNDYVISLRSFQGGIEHSEYAGCVSPAYTVLNPVKSVDYGFYRYLLKSRPYICALQSATDSLREGKSITYDQFGKIAIPLPSPAEQRMIASFLDRETGKIDVLIGKQERMIALLKEKRQAVISHAVTKGLDPNAPMKDSGVEWLGEIPEGWGISALGYYAKLNTGATPDRSKPKYWSGDIPWIKTGEVHYDTIYETEEHITEEGFARSAVQLSPPGTLLMAMYGQGVTRGRVAILGAEATYNQACVAITPNRFILNTFLRFYFMAAYHALRDGGNVTSQMNLNVDIVSKFKITVPPSLDEQKMIVSYLESEMKQYDHLISKAEQAIGLMKERRTALISAAVTGKIDVRGATQASPEQGN